MTALASLTTLAQYQLRNTRLVIMKAPTKSSKAKPSSWSVFISKKEAIFRPLPSQSFTDELSVVSFGDIVSRSLSSSSRRPDIYVGKHMPK